MIATWPTELPPPERNTWSRVPQEARIKRTSDAGPPRWRRRMSAASETVELSLLLSRDLAARFDRFYKEATAQGTYLFWMPDPTRQDWALISGDGQQLLLGSGQPLFLAGQWLCSFGDHLPTETIVGVNMRKTFSVVVMP